MHLGKNLNSCISQLKHSLVPLLKEADNSKLDYLDVACESGVVSLSFLETKRAKDVVGDPLQSKLRQSGKVGRVLKKLLPKTTDDDIRTFVEALQAEMTKHLHHMFVVNGDQVRLIYQIPRTDCHTGELQSSCYQGIVLDDNFEFAERNPEIVKCLVALKDGKLAGRALHIHGKCNDKDAILVECLHGTPPAIGLMRKYFSQLKIPNTYTSSFRPSEFVANIKPGKMLHHVCMGVSHNLDRITTGYYERAYSDRWYKGTSYTHSKEWVNPEALKMLKIPKESILV